MFGSIPKFLKTANTEFHLRIGATARLPPRFARTTHGNFRSSFRCLACYFSIVVGSCVAQNYKDRMTMDDRILDEQTSEKTSVVEHQFSSQLKWSKKLLRQQRLRLRLITIHLTVDHRTGPKNTCSERSMPPAKVGPILLQQMPMSSHLGRPTSAKIPRAWTCPPPLRQKKRTC